MLTNLEILYVRCFVSVSVPLKPLTVLIGRNNTGKTSFLRVINKFILGDQAKREDEVWRGPGSPWRIGAKTSNGSDFRLSRDDRLPTKFLEDHNPVLFLKLTPGRVPMTCANQLDGQGPPVIAENGDGVPALLDYLLRTDRARFDNFVTAVRNYVPGVDGVNVSAPQAATRGITLLVEGGQKIRAEQSSDGVQLMLLFIAIAYHPSPPRTILLEEPENGVHPKRLADIVHLLRGITKGEHCGRAAQVVLTTHSPYLLDCIDANKDQVLVFRRNEKDGSRTAEPVDPKRLQDFLRDFTLGEVWYNQDEGGLT